jgi:hypothetical protein
MLSFLSGWSPRPSTIWRQRSGILEQAMEEQKSGECASTDAAAGTQDAAVQENKIRAEIPLKHAVV